MKKLFNEIIFKICSIFNRTSLITKHHVPSKTVAFIPINPYYFQLIDNFMVSESKIPSAIEILSFAVTEEEKDFAKHKLDTLFFKEFNPLFQHKMYKKAREIALLMPDCLSRKLAILSLDQIDIFEGLQAKMNKIIIS
jgi:hypothetical protein